MRFLIFLFAFQLGMAQTLGQGPDIGTARVRAIRALLLPYGITIQSTFQEKTTEKGSRFMEAHCILVAVNNIPGIHILKEEKIRGEWNCWAEFNGQEAIQTLRENLQEDQSSLQSLRALPKNPNRTRAMLILEGEVNNEQKMLELLLKNN